MADDIDTPVKHRQKELPDWVAWWGMWGCVGVVLLIGIWGLGPALKWLAALLTCGGLAFALARACELIGKDHIVGRIAGGLALLFAGTAALLLLVGALSVVVFEGDRLLSPSYSDPDGPQNWRP